MRYVRDDRASSKMLFIIWGGVGEKFEICVRKNKEQSRFNWIYLVLIKKVSVIARSLYFLSKQFEAELHVSSVC